MVSAGDGWAVGNGGTIVRWDGVAWRLVDSSTEQSLNSVSLASISDGWAVGSNGAMVHWDGVRWIEFFATPNDLNSVQMHSASDGWAVGDRGTILRWDGSDWWPVTSPTTDDLYEISMAGNDAGWAVGGAFHETSHCGTGYWSSVLLRWDGVTWSQAVYPVSGRLFHVAMVSADQGWAAGENGAILMWNGNGWNATTPYVDRNWALNDIAMASAIDGWAVGGDYHSTRIMHWDGVTWAQVTSPVNQGLNAIDLLAPDDGWAVGQQGVILRWDGRAWSQVDSPVTVTLNDIDMVSPTDGWAVGDYPGVILRWDGVQWSQVDVSPLYSDLYGIDMLSSTDGWVVGSEQMMHWDGQAWTGVSGCSAEYLFDVDMVSASDGWIGGGTHWGYGGWEDMVCRWDGINWSSSSVPSFLAPPLRQHDVGERRLDGGRRIVC